MLLPLLQDNSIFLSLKGDAMYPFLLPSFPALVWYTKSGHQTTYHKSNWLNLRVFCRRLIYNQSIHPVIKTVTFLENNSPTCWHWKIGFNNWKRSKHPPRHIGECHMDRVSLQKEGPWDRQSLPKSANSWCITLNLKISPSFLLWHSPTRDPTSAPSSI